MKHIAQLTALYTLAATISYAGMVADDLTAPPVMQPAQKCDVVSQPNHPAKKAQPTTATAKSIKNDTDSDKIEQLPTEILLPTPTTQPPGTKYSIFAAIGQGDGNVKSVALGFDLYSKIKWFADGNWHLTPYTEFMVSYWEGDAGHTGTESLHEGGLSVYGRYIRKKTKKLSISPYFDAGIGLHYITEDKIEGKELGRQWLAGSNLGIGLILGESEKFDVGVRIRHLSNGGTEDINWGINHIMLRLALRF